MFNRTKKTSTIAAIAGGAMLLLGGGAMAASQQADPAPGDIGTSNCAASDFALSMTPLPDKPGPAFALEIKNTSDKTCELNGGWPGVSGTDMTGEPVEQLPTENVQTPPAVDHFSLTPGQAAYAGVAVHVGAKGDPNSYVITGFQAHLPDMPEQLVVDLPQGAIEIPAKSLEVTEMVADPGQLS
ncbi:DUF4232 domain-containing protein [Saccharopolyspora sp. CA-218241]|uniref:DUF4232 domain-containing protein n=1 Tax=Saccharopolyspora sp. CA-218241 TaxID=3240027 RepID=UPI003D96C026